MSGTVLLLLSSVLATTAAAVVASGCAQPRPSLRRAITDVRRLERADERDGSASRRWADRLAAGLANHAPFAFPGDVELRLVGRTREAHAILLVTAAVAGVMAPVVLLGTLQAAGVVSPAVAVPVGLALAAMAVGPVLVHTATVERASDVRTDLRHQLSAFLDVVAMLVAGNVGHEGALDEAARAGDGRLFAELRRRTRESAATGRSLVDALDVAGRELGLDELRQVASTAALSATEGAPVGRTLTAKCATLRSTLASEQESEARLRTSRLTTPIVGMALIFMSLVIYPALTFS
jgi:tight adherence protein C